MALRLPVRCGVTAIRSRVHRDRLTRRLPPSGRSAFVPPGSGLPDIPTFADDAGAVIAASDTGAAVFLADGAVLVVVPPFPIERGQSFDAIEPAPLVELLARPRTVGVFLLRLGGYSVGFFRGESLIDSKTGNRFVKNRHRKGGQSQRRFERIREKQVDELFDDACSTAARVLAPHDAEIEHVFLGGTKQTVAAFRKQCDFFDRYGGRLRARILAVTSDPRHASLEAIPREIWSCDVFTFTNG